ncbi:MAG: FprA family A-type flavoprotein [Dehalococcoidales bacterium]|nr:FprA family A-type flavoprotein [Dehalococcoidales bacterium]
MTTREIRPGTHWVGAVDWNRRLFDALIPLPDGTSYNSYLIKGSEKTALIDTVDPSMRDVLLNHLAELGIENLDYVVAHHAEQDHSGTIPVILEKYPQAKVVTNLRCKGMLIDLLPIPEDRFIIINDRETLSLGDKTLEFVYTPWVHWPETMSSYLKEQKILFSCDFFGAHLATSDLFVTDEWQSHEAAKRYYAEIMMPFRSNIHQNLENLKSYAIDIIATSHGPIYNRPEFILDAYHHWVFDEPGNIVVLPYVSMHGSTYEMVNYLTGALVRSGVTVKQFDMTVTDSGKLAIALVDAATVVLGVPTVLAGAHPSIAYATSLTNALRPKLKFISIIGSYGWGGKTVEQLTGMISSLKVEILEPVLCKGFPREADFRALDNLAATIAVKHRENNFS